MKKIAKILLSLTVCLAFFMDHTSGQVEKSTVSPATTALDFPCPPDLRIKFFEDLQPGIPNAQKKDWKVVVGRPFRYKATPGNGANWAWQVGNGDFWQINAALNGNNDSQATIGIANIPLNNNDFGQTQGNVEVSATVGGGPQTSNQQIEVFFNKDEPYFHDPAVPNWFHYWGQTVGGLLTTTGIKVFNVNALATEAVLQIVPPVPIAFTLRYRNDGNFHWQDPPDPNTPQLFAVNNLGNQMVEFQYAYLPGGCCNDGYRKVLTGYPGNLPDMAVIDIGEGCSKHYRIYDYGPGPNAYSGELPPDFDVVRGIDAFYALLNHELVHWTLFEEFWSETGYDCTFDCDGDFYPDAWEMGPVGMSYGFDASVEDKYSENYVPENLPGTAPGDPPGNFTSGTWFHEEKCRRREASTHPGPHNQDWSYDPTGVNQGKQW